jgi:hypothetical protein
MKDKNEYPVSKAINNLLDITNNKISNEFIKYDFENELKLFKDKINELNETQQKGVEFIQEHCESLRLKLSDRIGIVIKSINIINEQLTKQIDDYQQDCTRQWLFEQDDYKVNLNKLIEDNNKFFTNFENLFTNRQRLTITSDDITEAVNKMKSNSLELNEEIVEIKNYRIFNFKKLEFIPNDKDDAINIAIIGDMNYSNNYDDKIQKEIKNPLLETRRLYHQFSGSNLFDS